MVDIQYELLKAMQDPCSKEGVVCYVAKKLRLPKDKMFRVYDAFDTLEGNDFIEELSPEEIDLIRRGLPNDFSGVCESTDLYILTEFGVCALGDEKNERFRFYAPFVVSTLISLVSLVTAIVSICIQL